MTTLREPNSWYSESPWSFRWSSRPTQGVSPSATLKAHGWAVRSVVSLRGGVADGSGAVGRTSITRIDMLLVAMPGAPFVASLPPSSDALCS